MDKIGGVPLLAWVKLITAVILAVVLGYMIFTNNPHTEHAIRILLVILSLNQGVQSIATWHKQ